MRTGTKIFLKGLRTEKNCQAGFRKDILLETPPAKAVLRVTACTFYRAYLNGEILFRGPAKAAHRFARIDTRDITKSCGLDEKKSISFGEIKNNQ